MEFTVYVETHANYELTINANTKAEAETLAIQAILNRDKNAIPSEHEIDSIASIQED